MIRKVAAWMVGSWVALAAAAESWASQGHGAPYVPTPDGIIEGMLDLARVRAGDHVVDLGSGDGRVVIQAARRGAYGQGVDVNRALLRKARSNADSAGVGDLVGFVEQDLFDADLSCASVVTIYLLPDANLKLRPALLAQLRPGTRVVSHGFSMGKWEPDRSSVLTVTPGCTRSIHLWIIPADVTGSWEWQLDGGQRFIWRVNQHFQKLETALEVNGTTVASKNPLVRGRQLSFAAEHDGVRYNFSGRVEGGQIDGIAQAWNGDLPRMLEWRACLRP